MIADAQKQSDISEAFMRRLKWCLSQYLLKWHAQNKEQNGERQWPWAEPLPACDTIHEHPRSPEVVYIPESFKENTADFDLYVWECFPKQILFLSFHCFILQFLS